MQPGIARTVLVIMGMRDNGCRERVAETLEEVAGVQEVDVNLFRARAVVLHLRSCSRGALVGAVECAGYQAIAEGE